MDAPARLTFLQHLATFSISKSPVAMGVNCDSTRLLVTDINGNAVLVDVRTGKPIEGFERKDVWHFRWARDNPILFAIMEK